MEEGAKEDHSEAKGDHRVDISNSYDKIGYRR